MFFLTRMLFLLLFFMQVNIGEATNVTQPVRALHIVLSPLEIKDLEKIINMAHQAEFNTIILDLGRKVAFKTFPGVLVENSWSPTVFLKLVEYIRFKGMEVIPAVSLLTHQDQFFRDAHPSLMFNYFVYNPEKSRVYDLIFPYLQEIIETIHPYAIHIGHDEVYKNLPASSYFKDVKLIHNYLLKREVMTWMWGDMLISRDELPNMRPWAVNGNAFGYGAEMRRKLPKDIVICDWHYADNQDEFPSIQLFQKSGFNVVGATWRKLQVTQKFSRYSADKGANGMIITTWFDPKEARVVQSWNELSEIIGSAGKVFMEYFPDEK